MHQMMGGGYGLKKQRPSGLTELYLEAGNLFLFLFRGDVTIIISSNERYNYLMLNYSCSKNDNLYYKLSFADCQRRK